MSRFTKDKKKRLCLKNDKKSILKHQIIFLLLYLKMFELM